MVRDCVQCTERETNSPHEVSLERSRTEAYGDFLPPVALPHDEELMAGSLAKVIAKWQRQVCKTDRRANGSVKWSCGRICLCKGKTKELFNPLLT